MRVFSSLLGAQCCRRGGERVLIGAAADWVISLTPGRLDGIFSCPPRGIGSRARFRRVGGPRKAFGKGRRSWASRVPAISARGSGGLLKRQVANVRAFLAKSPVLTATLEAW